MRLTDDILRMSDNYHADIVTQAFKMASAGRFGIIPSNQPFQTSLNIYKNTIEIVSLNCLGLTKKGQLIDISYDSQYTQLGDTRIAIPTQSEGKSYLLLVSITDKWVDVGQNSCEPQPVFSLLEENNPIPDDAIPIARIVNEMGWREDDFNFIPPCILISSHRKYIDANNSFKELLVKLEKLVYERLNTDSGYARMVFWPEVRRLAIVVDKESETMSPMSLLARIQECICSFHCACTLDETLGLSEAEKYAAYVKTPYNYKDCYLIIKEGLSLLTDICTKLENITIESVHVQEPAIISAPWIKESDLHINASSNNVRVEVQGLASNAVGYYSLDNSEPSKPLQSGRFIPLDPKFNKTRTKEDDRTYAVKLKSISGNNASKVVSFNLTVSKDVNIWKGFQI